MDHKISVIDKAFSFIDNAIKTGRYQEGERLPTIKALSREAGVSVVSMWKAIDRLKSRGCVHTRQGGSIIVGKAGHDDSVPDIPQCRWEQIRALLEKDILIGSYAQSDQLPTLAELQAQYGICYCTLKKILDALVHDGIVIPRSKGYQLVRPGSPRYRSSITLFTTGSSIDKIETGTGWTGSFINALERECIKANITVLPAGVDVYAPGGLSPVRRFLAKKQGPIGFVINVGWREIHQRQMLIDLISELVLRRKPVAIVDATGDLNLAPALMARKEVRVFTISARIAGQTMARRMLSLGHRTIAYLSVFHKDNWSIRRLQGIKDIYVKAGLGDRVTAIDLGFPGNYSLFESVLGIINFPDDKIIKLFGVDLPDELVKDLLAACEAARKSGTLPVVEPSVIKKISSDFEMLIDCVDGNMNPEVLARMRDQLVVSSWNQVLEKGLAPRFARLLENNKVTAWIASDDVTAMAAVRNLNAWKVAIPGRLSIASFDNGPDSFEQGLTSYDFNIPGVVRQVLLFISSTPGLNRVHAYRPIEVPGVLIERRSTATGISLPISANR